MALSPSEKSKRKQNENITLLIIIYLKNKTFNIVFKLSNNIYVVELY